MRLYERNRIRRRNRRIVILVIFAALLFASMFLLLAKAETRCGGPGEPTEASEEIIYLETAAKPFPEGPGAVPGALSETETEAAAETETESEYPEFTYSKDWGAEDSYLLAKITMAEAEGESLDGKTRVILVVLNRVWNDDFPGTIRGVIFEKGQFTSVVNGRFDRVEPNDECWEAVEAVMTAKYDYSEGALYFERATSESTWHSRNLEFLYQCGNHKFYK